MYPTEAILFESRDIEIFNIPDVKTKLNTLQNYFFPRLQKLLDNAIVIIRDVYEIEPFEKYSTIYRPSHRREAKRNKDFKEVFVGLSGRREKGKQLIIKREDGVHYSIHPATLCFNVAETRNLSVELLPFNRFDESYFRAIKRYFRKHYDELSSLLNAGKLSCESQNSSAQLSTVEKMLKDDYLFKITSPTHYFPIKQQEALADLTRAFVLMFPLLDACYDIAEGISPKFPENIRKLRVWLNEHPTVVQAQSTLNPIFPLPELNSYTFVRAGLWYQVLARDNWTCCSCRRRAKEYGIVLHVDHILPRSLGGKDELENLQTLCLKCNIGKSNKDTTDLR